MAMDATELAREQARRAIWSYLNSITPKGVGDAEIDRLTDAAMQVVDGVGKKPSMSDPRYAPPVANVRVFEDDERRQQGPI